MSERFDYPPTQAEAMRALRKQAAVNFKFYLNPRMTIEDRIREIDEALAPLKSPPDTRKYSLSELKEISLKTDDDRLKILYNHEANHAEQMQKVLSQMGIGIKPEFDVYYCPILADMYSYGGAIGLLHMRRDILHLTRDQILEFDTRLALKMLKSSENSLGDIYIIIGVIGGKVLSEVRKRFPGPEK
jgi:hypothetical protein